MASKAKSAAQVETKAALSQLGTNLNTSDDDATVVDVLAAKEVAAKFNHNERIEIQLEENEEIPPGGQFIGVNGNGYLLKPGQPAKVTLGIIEALNNMVMSVPILDDNKSILGYRDRLRFPYRILTKGVARA